MIQFKPIENQANNDMTGYNRLFGVYLHGHIESEAGYDIVYAKNCETEHCRFHYDGTDKEYDFREWEQAKFNTPCTFICQVELNDRIAMAQAFIWEDKYCCHHLNPDGTRMFPDDYMKRYHGLIVELGDADATNYAKRMYAQQSCVL